MNDTRYFDQRDRMFADQRDRMYFETKLPFKLWCKHGEWVIIIAV